MSSLLNHLETCLFIHVLCSLLWKLELDYDFYRIYDSQKMIVGYFDPDYGEVLSKENHEEKIIQMLNNHDLFFGGFLTLPLVRFGLFNTDLNIDIEELRAKINNVSTHLDKWASFIANTNEKRHSIHVSHTDQDMLAITIHMRFNQPIPLKENEIMCRISPTLSSLQEMSLI